ncbi:MAG: flavin reductase family protein [Chloroflexi bacterium]|nr:flavin reductase family protein [Chloroflexota bacterium]MDA1240684.1 flavin reductase family protein [Chloroflexota bacterium]
MAEDPLLNRPPDDTEERPISEASRLLMGGPVVLVTTTWRGKTNVMPLAWHMPLSSKPQVIGISVEQSRHSAEMISHAQEFALNFPKRPYLHHVQYLGALSGEQIDKLDALQMETFPSTTITAPLIADCAAWIECQVVEVTPIGDHIVFAGLVTAVRIDTRSYEDGRWSIGDDEHRPLHFLGGHTYSALDRALQARLPHDYEAPERVLRDRILEELELTREARERREEQLAMLEREIERGNVVDIDELKIEIDTGDDRPLDLSRGAIL